MASLTGGNHVNIFKIRHWMNQITKCTYLYGYPAISTRLFNHAATSTSSEANNRDVVVKKHLFFMLVLFITFRLAEVTFTCLFLRQLIKSSSDTKIVEAVSVSFDTLSFHYHQT